MARALPAVLAGLALARGGASEAGAGAPGDLIQQGSLRGGRRADEVTPPDAAAEEVDEDCAITGFWELDDNIVMRFWKVDEDLGDYQRLGRGQCIDAGGRSYMGWLGKGVDFRTCKDVCDSSEACVGLEYSQTGECVVRYDASLGAPERPPIPALATSEAGDDGTGEVAGTAGTLERVCLMRPQGGGRKPAPRAGARGSWRVEYIARSGQWALGGDRSSEAPLQVSAARPLRDLWCVARPPDVQGPFALDIRVWWGTEAVSAWAGLPSSTPPRANWDILPDQASWDTSAVAGSGRCPVAREVTSLVGMVNRIQHALWGMRTCSSSTFRRLAPESATLNADGWRQVVADRWLFGVEVYSRRLVASAQKAIVDEACFKGLVKRIWGAASTTDFDAVNAQLLLSACVK